MNFEYSDNLRIYFKDIRKSTHFSKEKEQEIGKRIESGDRSAIEELVKANLKLVVTIANKHIGQGLSIDDLIQEGNIGLYEAACSFRPSEGKFSTYAQLWIRKRINEAVAQKGRIIRLPHNQEYEIYKAKKQGKEFQEFSIIELDKPTGDDSEEHVSDRFLGNSPDIELDHEKEYLIFNIKKRLSSLNEKEQEIVKMYFGIDCEYPVPSEIIAERMEMTQVRVCQIIKTSIKKMKKIF